MMQAASFTLTGVSAKDEKQFHIHTEQSGLEKTLAMLAGLQGDLGAQLLARAGTKFMEKVREDSMDQTPVLTGTLKGTHFVAPAVISGSKVTIPLWVGGGPAKKYAVRQHEEINWKHKVGNAKFLENALRSNAPHADSFCAREIMLEMASHAVAAWPAGTW